MVNRQKAQSLTPAEPEPTAGYFLALRVLVDRLVFFVFFFGDRVVFFLVVFFFAAISMAPFRRAPVEPKLAPDPPGRPARGRRRRHWNRLVLTGSRRVSMVQASNGSRAAKNCSPARETNT